MQPFKAVFHNSCTNWQVAYPPFLGASVPPLPTLAILSALVKVRPLSNPFFFLQLVSKNTHTACCERPQCTQDKLLLFSFPLHCYWTKKTRLFCNIQRLFRAPGKNIPNDVTGPSIYVTYLCISTMSSLLVDHCFCRK